MITFFTIVLSINLVIWLVNYCYRWGAKSLTRVDFESDPRRAIYCYFTGETVGNRRQYKKIDPLQAMARLKTDPEYDEDKHLKMFDETHSTWASAVMARATVRAFGVKEFDPETGQGLTESELCALLWDFDAWLKKNGGNIIPLPERQQLMAELQPNSSTTEITNNS